MITVITDSIYGDGEVVHKFETMEKAQSWIEKFDAEFDSRYVKKICPAPFALDGGDSAASQALSSQSGESTPEVNPMDDE